MSYLNELNDDIYYTVNLSRKEMKQVLDFIEDDIVLNSKLYRDVNELLERMYNIYIRMMPKDFVEIAVWWQNRRNDLSGEWRIRIWTIRCN